LSTAESNSREAHGENETEGPMHALSQTFIGDTFSDFQG